ncbi:hypothetical protein BX666DRAFT_1979192, partial [Dichotomocladium elegans]
MSITHLLVRPTMMEMKENIFHRNIGHMGALSIELPPLLGLVLSEIHAQVSRNGKSQQRPMVHPATWDRPVPEVEGVPQKIVQLEHIEGKCG